MAVSSVDRGAEATPVLDQIPEVRSREALPRLGEFRIRWQILISLIVVHAGAIAAFWFFTWPAFWTALGLWVATGMLGISVGYHRLLAHRSYETFPIVRNFHATCGTIALQLGPIAWVKIHRAHHAFSDTIQDPHPQQYGFLFGHFGWAFLSHKTLARVTNGRVEAPDLTSSRYLRFLDKYHFHLFVLSYLVLFAVGGLPFLLWAGCFRTVWLLHTTWMVNSLAHGRGVRRFNTEDTSTNNATVALLTWGEGWHNNHHRFPASAKFGLYWYELDLGWLWLNLLRLCGLVWHLKTPASYSPPPS